MGRTSVIVLLQRNMLALPIYLDLCICGYFQDKWCTALKTPLPFVLRKSNHFSCAKVTTSFKSQFY